MTRHSNGILCVHGGAPTEIRTPVVALKGLRPGPLDDGGRLIYGAGGFYHPRGERSSILAIRERLNLSCHRDTEFTETFLNSLRVLSVLRGEAISPLSRAG